MNLPVPAHETLEVQDASKMQEYMTCERLYFFRYVLGYTSEEPIHNLVFGSAWHLAKRVLLTNRPWTAEIIEAAYQAFLTEYRKTYHEATDLDLIKNPARARLGLYSYAEQYADDDYKNLITEKGIVVPISDKWKLYGKMDSILQDDLRGIYSLEHKTAGRLYSYWADSWKLKFQVNLYHFFLYAYFPPEQVGGIVIDGTVFRKNEVEHVRVPVKKSPEAMEAFLFQATTLFQSLEDDFDRLSHSKPEDVVLKAFPRRTENCVKYNRLCPCFDICQAWENPLQHLDSIPAGYKVEHWDPRKEDAEVTINISSLKEEGEGENERKV